MRLCARVSGNILLKLLFTDVRQKTIVLNIKSAIREALAIPEHTMSIAEYSLQSVRNRYQHLKSIAFTVFEIDTQNLKTYV